MTAPFNIAKLSDCNKFRLVESWGNWNAASQNNSEFQKAADAQYWPRNALNCYKGSEDVCRAWEKWDAKTERCHAALWLDVARYTCLVVVCNPGLSCMALALHAHVP